MLRELRIQDFAIIDRLEIHFHDQLNALTGETGSGKSIVVDAVDLLLGGRAASEQIRTGKDEAVLEAVFGILEEGPIAQHLRGADPTLEVGDELIIRRVVSRSGKSRAQINGRLVTAGQLQQVGNLLVDFHGQHAHQSLLHPEPQLFLLDAFAGQIPRREDFNRKYLAYQDIRRELEEGSAKERERIRREDYLKFQVQEIESAQLVPGEDMDLERERNILSNAERLAILTEEIYQVLYESDGAILTQLARVVSLLGELAGTDDRMRPAADDGTAAAAQLRDIAAGLRDYKEAIEYDPKRLEQIEDRLHLIADLKKKYAPTLEEIRTILLKITEEQEGLRSNTERLEALNRTAAAAREECTQLARRLTKERIRAARTLEKKVEKELGLLGMGKTTFQIRIETDEAFESLGPTGGDVVEFVVSPNPGEEPKPLARIASGGELSRVMLSLKSILAAEDRIPTLVFDEVDAGIGGDAAVVVGKRLKELARRHQVLCVTHLPQIASQAETHFSVEKLVSEGRTVTRVRELDKKDRVEEIARMLGGRELTPTAFKHAREMLDLAAQ